MFTLLIMFVNSLSLSGTLVVKQFFIKNCLVRKKYSVSETQENMHKKKRNRSVSGLGTFQLCLNNYNYVYAPSHGKIK